VNGENRPPTTDAIQQAAKRLDFQATKRLDYAERLQHLEAAWWKRLLDVQRPYRWNLRRSHLGCTLDLGCGIGRNLMNLDPGSVGIDHNRHSVAVARERGLTAYTTDEFLGSALSRRLASTRCWSRMSSNTCQSHKRVSLFPSTCQ
jgi:SAM-dependent methyltransferase